MRNVLKQIFEFMSFFCVIFSFSDMVDFVFNSEVGTFCEPDSEANQRGWGFNLKVSGAWGSP